MTKMDITMDNDLLLRLMSRLSKFSSRSVMPETAAAMKKSADFVRETWKGFAMGGTLPGVEKLKNPQGGYARSIVLAQIGPFDYEVISRAEIADWLQNGTTTIDMKETHTRGPRSRVARKKGPNGQVRLVPYVIVPFRWGTPKTVGFRNIMPESVYAVVKAKKFVNTKVTGETHTEVNFRGENVERQEYSSGDGKNSWGSTLGMGDSEDVTPNMEGMSKMKGQGGKSAGYFTFRVISADSPAGSWIRPGMKPRPITEGVIGASKEIVNDLIDLALRRDLGI
ncbi:hypothetical protein FACS189447_03320 [Spirochaetia bacterium]|nr:hypothetical protein FACS189447_03320 [Spirochaetia bacterium]